jgi:hypothetical protein
MTYKKPLNIFVFGAGCGFFNLVCWVSKQILELAESKNKVHKFPSNFEISAPSSLTSRNDEIGKN